LGVLLAVRPGDRDTPEWSLRGTVSDVHRSADGRRTVERETDRADRPVTASPLVVDT
jgi:hypothetical protein